MQNAMYHVSVEDVSGNQINTAAYETEVLARRGAAKALRNPIHEIYRVWLRYPSGIAVELTRTGPEATREMRQLIRPSLRRTRMAT